MLIISTVSVIEKTSSTQWVLDVTKLATQKRNVSLGIKHDKDIKISTNNVFKTREKRNRNIGDKTRNEK